MRYEITADHLHQLRAALGVHGGLSLMATTTDQPALRTDVDEVAMFGNNILDDISWTDELFALFLATAAFNSNLFRRTLTPTSYTFGRVEAHEVEEFVDWLVFNGYVPADDQESIVNKPEMLGKLRLAWLGLLWRVFEGKLVTYEGNLRFDILHNRAKEMLVADGSGMGEQEAVESEEVEADAEPGA